MSPRRNWRPMWPRRCAGCSPGWSRATPRCPTGSVPTNSISTSGNSAGQGFTGALNWYRNYDRNWETTPQLSDATITAPALFIGGTADPIGATMNPARAREVAAGPYREEWVDGAGHWVQQERPDDVNRILLAFLRDVDAS